MINQNNKKILFSGIQPTGEIHIGNYLGAIKNWVELQNSGNYNCIYSIVDLHAITIDYDSKKYQDIILDLAATLIACGIDPKKSILFVQSNVKEHTELCWLLNTITPVAELQRMTQFKDKSGINILMQNRNKLIHEAQCQFEELDKDAIKDSTNVKVNKNKYIKLLEAITKNYFQKDLEEKTFNESKIGLLDYPVLMASDILLYNAEVVPVGYDQSQHLELTNMILRKFNNKFGEYFKKVNPYITTGAKIMALNDPEKKMSKSISGSYISLSDTPDEIRKKISRAVTDSNPSGEMSHGVKNLFDLLLFFEARDIHDKFLKQYKNKIIKYSELKSELADVIIKKLEPIQYKKKELLKNPKKLKSILDDGAKQAQKIASKNILEIKRKMGLI
ncbi:MAG: tryptophan--tRNA ligase [Patescibacteria group bacterium]|nr:tryptophan--tRNA ligase [Patescibacteria group bacterium]MDD4304010.1 tryptophan--tRNA ligase [Patescibacteria group bacterium]MDD4695001.1 tryptophan--tRNA ligase [Patescibacteria group bacterium]